MGWQGKWKGWQKNVRLDSRKDDSSHGTVVQRKWPEALPLLFSIGSAQLVKEKTLHFNHSFYNTEGMRIIPVRLAQDQAV